MTEMTGGQALVRSIYNEGVRVIFGLPGVQLYHAMDALYDTPEIRFITTRHEQGTTYMADGYARAGGTIGTAMVVPGPGLQNAGAGLGNAYACSSPVLLISGQINKKNIGRDVGILHEVNDQLDIIDPVTKWNARIMNAAEVPGTVQEAFRQLRNGRPRPVEIEIPPETLAEVADIELCKPAESVASAPEKDEVEDAVTVLMHAERPIIWAGGGVISSGASKELLELAEYLQAPVITTPEGKGAISDRHYLSVGVTRGRSTGQTRDALRMYFWERDVILAVGTRFAGVEALAEQKVVQIDIDEQELGRNHADTVGVAGDAKLALKKILAGCREAGPQADSRREECETLRGLRYDPANQIEPLGGFVRTIRECMPEDGILVPDMTQVGYYSRAYFQAYEPRTYFTSSYAGNLGFAYPTALGAKVAQPDKVVISPCGDGGFLYNSQELATAAQFGINVIAIVFNDGAYGNVLRDQQEMFNGRVIGSELQNPDFVKLAEAYGVVGMKAESPEGLGVTLRKAVDLDKPVLIEVPLGQMPAPF